MHLSQRSGPIAAGEPAELPWGGTAGETAICPAWEPHLRQSRALPDVATIPVSTGPVSCAASTDLSVDVVHALTVCVRDGTAADLRAVSRDVGPPGRLDGHPATEAPVMEVRFVDRLQAADLRRLDGGRVAYARNEVYALGRRGITPVARIDQGPRWGEGTIVCRHGLGRVPFLSAAVDLAAIAGGWIPLHASGWITPDGIGVLASGFAHSGKTGALLAACENGARPVGDDRVLLSGDGQLMVGLGRPVHAKDWHIAQLQLACAEVGSAQRALARSTYALAPRRGARRGPKWKRLLEGALDRAGGLSSVEVPLRDLDDAAQVRPHARPHLLLIMETHDSAEVVAEPADPRSVPTRLAVHVGAELVPTLRSQLAYDYVHPRTGWHDVSSAPSQALALLERAARGIPAWIIRHPYPCSLERLHAVTSQLAVRVSRGLRSRA